MHHSIGKMKARLSQMHLPPNHKNCLHQVGGDC